MAKRKRQMDKQHLLVLSFSFGHCVACPSVSFF
jgi:hypothetical protein